MTCDSARVAKTFLADIVDKHGKVIEPERRPPAAASPRLQNLIIGAIETCCRRAALSNLRWRDVDLDSGELTVRVETAKGR